MRKTELELIREDETLDEVKKNKNSHYYNDCTWCITSKYRILFYDKYKNVC